ncbi:MAG: TonB-dependent receptor [Gammaproteobacteria bacterium]
MSASERPPSLQDGAGSAPANVSGTAHKALRINLDPETYGTIAEIGAGQETARWFFRVGGAAGTLAKAMSAYDMVFSDSIYGSAERYVSRERLDTMLDHEYGLLVERLNTRRGAQTRFFAFADTVAAHSYKHNQDGHGWLGVRSQTQAQEPPSQIVLHVRLWDKENVQQQEALGILGVNLIYGALYAHETPAVLLDSLVEDVTATRVEVDMVEFEGPAFQNVDNRLMALRLVENGLTNAAMFTADGRVIQPADVLYKKAVLVQRGKFHPVTKADMDMLGSAHKRFLAEAQVQGESVAVLLEMTLNSLTNGDGKEIDPHDFLQRVDMIGALGQTVLISNYGEYHKLAGYLFRYTQKMVGLVMRAASLKAVFDEKYYVDLQGGILESFGRLFKNDLKTYVYPLRDPESGDAVTAQTLQVAPNLKHLYAYLLENGFIEGLEGVDPDCLAVSGREVLERIRDGDPAWESMVPEPAAALIKEHGLFGYRG